jgi:hypothetical protein
MLLIAVFLQFLMTFYIVEEMDGIYGLFSQ